MTRPARNDEEPVVLTVPQAARLLQVSTNHLYSLISQDLIPHLRLGKLIRIPRWSLVNHVATESGSPIPVDSALADNAIQSGSVHRLQKEDGA